VAFPVPDTYSSGAADMERDEAKRTTSPPSFFFGRGWGLVLAANYFTDQRLSSSHSAVAAKHRHRIQSATFGMLMAAFEWCAKDFIAQVLTATEIFDDQVQAAKWISLDTSSVLAQRASSASVGGILIHPTLGWHDPTTLHRRYSELFKASPLRTADRRTLERLWLLRHTVAHNAGFVTPHDAYRMSAPSLSGRSVRIDERFLEDTWTFLTGIVRRLGDPVGMEILDQWCRQRPEGDFGADRASYVALKTIATVVEGRDKDLPTFGETDYRADLAAAAGRLALGTATATTPATTQFTPQPPSTP
jgi:hypothetical protein